MKVPECRAPRCFQAAPAPFFLMTKNATSPPTARRTTTIPTMRNTFTPPPEDESLGTTAKHYDTEKVERIRLIDNGFGVGNVSPSRNRP